MKSLKDFFTNPSTVTHAEKRIGICLSGGAALGLAHIGVLQSLNDNQIYPNVIAGTSMGSIIGAMYAAGYTPTQMLQLIKDGKLYKLSNLMSFQPAFWKTGLSDQHIIINLLNELIPNNSFDKLEKNLFVCVSNLSTGNWEIINKGNDLAEWVSASSSIPGIFNAMKINNMVYVDGGLLNNLPAQPLRDVCDVIIGSNVICLEEAKKQLKPRDTLLRSVRVLQHQNSAPGKELCDFLIEPAAISKYNEFSFDAYQSIYQYGYRTTSQFISKNPDILKLKKNSK